MVTWRVGGDQGGAFNQRGVSARFIQSTLNPQTVKAGPGMSYHLRVKICGVTNEADARQAALLGADAVGLNFYPGSPRCVIPETAQFILRELPPFVAAVGVFVDVPLSRAFQRVQTLGRIGTIQWHGTNRELSDAYPFHLIAAFPIRDASSLQAIQRYLDTCRPLGRLPSALLLDGHAAGQHGGTGQAAPWQLLAGYQPGVPIILAGGLTPDNVAEAVRIVRPYGVDVASGVEHSPGHKDPEKMRRFIANAREAAARL
jgi:phosphoribosylanthranilate isomerase